MSIFKEFANVIYDVYEANMRWNEKVSKYKEQLQESDARKLRQKALLNESLERKERERYWNQYFEDPESVMIFPYGWSPFGFYL